jgi:hypothetical protein
MDEHGRMLRMGLAIKQGLAYKDSPILVQVIKSE